MIFSLDLRGGALILSGMFSQQQSPIEAARSVIRPTVNRLIVLDLARVGEGGGVGTEALCRQLRSEYPTLELIAGGGVRGQADLDALASAGCNAALVASALHDGRIGGSLGKLLR
jgi:phosphoribosylformimino-5-aminoimidazole carboxamide ribotide isomerase